VTPLDGLADRVRGALPRLGDTRLVCVDGPAGSGKTTLASAIVELSGAFLVRMDDLYPGWDGLFDVDPEVLGLLRPLSEDTTGYYRRFDWHDAEYRETHHVDPTPLLVLEGVGSGARAWAALTTTLVYVESPRSVRLRRGLDRDGDAQADHWRRFMVQEDVLLSRERTRARAHLVVPTP